MSAVLTPLAREVALKAGIIDRPVGNKIHTRPTPLMGGLAVYAAFVCTLVLFLPVSDALLGVIAGGLAAVLVGFLDELLTLPPLVHLAGQVAAACVAIVSGVGYLHTVSMPGALTAPGLRLPAAMGIALTVVWLVGMMNTMNFLDGLDGLATGVSAITALLLAIWAWEKHRFYLPETPHHEDFVLPLILAAVLLGFLPYNWHVAKIFLGDSGSMFLGFSLAALSIVGPAKLGTALLVLVIPVLDVAWAIVRRQMRGRSFLSGDKQHVYHRMLELGMTNTQTVVLLYVLCMGLAALDLWLVKPYKLIAFMVVAVLTGSVFILLEVRASRRRALVTKSPTRPSANA